MTDSIKTFDTYHEELLTNRTKAVGNTFIKSLKINQINGFFIISKPLSNSVKIYNQNPNSTSTDTIFNEITSLNSETSLNTPMDAVFDWIRRKIWIADTGNNRIVRLNYDTLEMDLSFTVSYYPYSIEINENNGNLFIKCFDSAETGKLIITDGIGDEIHEITYSHAFFNDNFEMLKTLEGLRKWDWQHLIKLDHVRNRLWWLADDILYMLSLTTKELFTNDLAQWNLDYGRSIAINLENGNAIVGCRPKKYIGEEYTNYAILAHFYKDNNYLLETKKVMDSDVIL